MTPGNDQAAIDATLDSATPADRGRYIAACDAYAEVRTVADLVASVEAAPDAEALLATATPADRADLVHVLSEADPFEREMRIRAIQRAWLDTHPERIAATPRITTVRTLPTLSRSGA